MFHPPAEYLPQLRELTREHGILWIDDEVMTGFGRTGKHFAYQHAPGVTPDLMVVGKGMVSAAFPAGGVVISREIAELMDRYRWETVSTFAGNPIVSAAVAANVEWLIEERVADRAAVLGRAPGTASARVAGPASDGRRRRRRRPALGRRARPSRRLGRALRPGGPAPRPDRAGRLLPVAVLAAECARHGVALATAPPNTLRLGPPLTTTVEHIDLGIAGLDAALAALDRLGAPVAS